MKDPVLRPWQLADAQALRQLCTEHPDLERQVGAIGSVTDAERAIAGYHEQAQQQTAIILALATDDGVVGSVSIASINRRHRTGWCSYWLAPDARGQGLATRALATIATVAFDRGLFRLELAHRVNNPASRAVATRAGFHAEGIERKKLEYDGIRYDCETHARLATDSAPQIEPLAVAE